MSDVTTVEAIAVTDPVRDIFHTCAKDNFYSEDGNRAFTSFDIFKAVVDPVNTEQDGPQFTAFAQDAMAMSLAMFSKLGDDGEEETFGTRILEVGAGSILFLEALGAAVLSAYTGNVLGHRMVLLVIVNGFDEPLVLGDTTYKKGTSSGHMTQQPGQSDGKGGFRKIGQVPAAFTDDNGTAYHGVGLFGFQRNAVGYFGVDAGLHFDCASKDCPNGVSVAFENGLSGSYKTAVSVNATDIAAFKKKYVDDHGNSSKPGYSHTSKGKVIGSIYPSRGMWIGDGHDNDVMVVTVVAGRCC